MYRENDVLYQKRRKRQTFKDNNTNRLKFIKTEDTKKDG
jgi:hypothetical protein